MKDLIIITGPTAVGKTNISIEIAKRINGEIVSADSMQIYKEMDIGSAKVTKGEMQEVPHHLIDIIDPSQSFSAADYREWAQDAIRDIINRGKVPIVAGGTGLYINSLIYEYDFTDADKDPEYRAQLQELAETLGKDYVHSMLKEVDEESYNRLFPNDLKRVIRALEVFKITGKKMSEFNSEKISLNKEYNIHYYVLTMDRANLYERINKRVDIMMNSGLLQEVINLKERGFTEDMQSMKGIGYKELLLYLDDKISLSEAIDMIKQGSRNYAKRQLTWFRKETLANWIDKEEFESDNHIIDYILKHIYS